MKQIFDWMRKQPLKAFEVYDGSIGVYPCEVNRLIDEAEAKWETDCCEWKKYEYDILFPYKTSCGHSEVFFDTFKFCPYCGKPIKISEVE